MHEWLNNTFVVSILTEIESVYISSLPIDIISVMKGVFSPVTFRGGKINKTKTFLELAL